MPGKHIFSQGFTNCLSKNVLPVPGSPRIKSGLSSPAATLTIVAKSSDAIYLSVPLTA